MTEHADLGAAIASAPRPDAALCPWCEVFTDTAAGDCRCDGPCGIWACPQRNADGYVPPPVPRFRR